MLRKRYNQYRELLNKVNDAVYTVDLKTGKFTSVNKAGERITGYPKKELLGLPFRQVIAPQYFPLVQKMINQKVRKNNPTVYEIEILRKDGNILPVEISSKLVTNDKGAQQILGIARDISERKRIEREKEIFVSLLTHEIKNPLTAMTMHMSFLQKLASDGTHQPMLASMTAIRQQIQSLTHLMNDFLEVNTIALGKFSIAKAYYFLDEQIEELIASFPKQKHTIEYKTKGRFKVRADKNRIRQVLHNLISNAMKYSPDANKIIIHAEKIGKYITVSVQDFGVGIPKEELKHMFQLFYRTKYSQQSNIKGHGLGLYIAKQIIHSHKGKIWVESLTGQGTIFYFTLPL